MTAKKLRKTQDQRITELRICLTGTPTWKSVYDCDAVKTKEDMDAPEVARLLNEGIGSIRICSDLQVKKEDFLPILTEGWFKRSTGEVHDGRITPRKKKARPEIQGERHQRSMCRLEEWLCMAFFNQSKLYIDGAHAWFIDYQVPVTKKKTNIDLVALVRRGNDWTLLLIEAKPPGTQESLLRPLLEICGHLDHLVRGRVLSGFVKAAEERARQLGALQADERITQVQPVVLLFGDDRHTAKGGLSAAKEASLPHAGTTELVMALNHHLTANMQETIAPLRVVIETGAQMVCGKGKSFHDVEKPILVALLLADTGSGQRPALKEGWVPCLSTVGWSDNHARHASQ